MSRQAVRWTWPWSEEDTAPRTDVEITTKGNLVVLDIDQGIEEAVRVEMSPKQVDQLVEALVRARRSFS